MTKTAAATETTTRCACSEFEIGLTTELPNGEPDFEGETTGCAAATRRVFAPGHDARLKSLLIKAGIGDMEVRYGQGITVTTDAVNAARQFGFAHLVQAGIDRGIAKAAAKAAKDSAPKAPRPKKDKAAAAQRAADLTTKMAAVAAKVTVAATPAPVAEPTVEAAPVVTEAPESALVKIGRWEYAAEIVDGDAHYVDKQGIKKVALEGNYRKVA